VLSALSALFRILLIAGALVWLARLPGEVSLRWGSYTLAADTGFLLGAVFALLLILLLLHRLVLEVAFFPKSWHWYRADRRVRSGLKLQAQALNALAADDPPTALRLANKAQDVLPAGYNGVSQLVRAQVARHAGRVDVMLAAYQGLAADKATRILGQRGQVATLVSQNRTREALDILLHLHHRFGAQPKWVDLAGTALALQSEDWEAAWVFLRGCERRKLRPLADIRSDQLALQMALADVALARGDDRARLAALQQAHKLDARFIPAVLALAEIYRAAGKGHKAKPLIARAWVNAPHPQLVGAWDALLPEKRAKKSLALTDWRRQLAKYNPDVAESHIMLAESCLQEGLWGAAREHLQAAEAQMNNPRIQKLWAQYEDKANNDSLARSQRLLLAAQMPPDPVWYCMRTGRIYPQWMPLALPHRSFNTIRWGRPEGHLRTPAALPDLIGFPELGAVP
jgi:HemY protein